MWLCKTCSKSLQDMDVRLTGRQFSAFDFDLLLPLWIGVTRACFQSFGTIDWFNVALKRRTYESATCSAHSFNKRDATLSGPLVFVGQRLLICFIMPLRVMVIWLIWQLFFPLMIGDLPSSFEKTLQYFYSVSQLWFCLRIAVGHSRLLMVRLRQ